MAGQSQHHPLGIGGSSGVEPRTDRWWCIAYPRRHPWWESRRRSPSRCAAGAALLHLCGDRVSSAPAPARSFGEAGETWLRESPGESERCACGSPLMEWAAERNERCSPVAGSGELKFDPSRTCDSMAPMPDHSSPADSEIILPRLLGVLSDPTRLGIVRILSDGAERGWGQFSAPVAKSTLSHHLKMLREAGVTQTRQEGTRCYVKLRGMPSTPDSLGYCRPCCRLRSQTISENT